MTFTAAEAARLEHVIGTLRSELSEASFAAATATGAAMTPRELNDFALAETRLAFSDATSSASDQDDKHA